MLFNYDDLAKLAATTAMKQIFELVRAVPQVLSKDPVRQAQADETMAHAMPYVLLVNVYFELRFLNYLA